MAGFPRRLIRESEREAALAEEDEGWRQPSRTGDIEGYARPGAPIAAPSRHLPDNRFHHAPQRLLRDLLPRSGDRRQLPLGREVEAVDDELQLRVFYRVKDDTFGIVMADRGQ